ncbi:MAG: hypothetical protein GF315_13870 [candidate division Zixibacteria bacterium]|nr:hypothetical protein [candidate division Zixibacteria bacterium]
MRSNFWQIFFGLLLVVIGALYLFDSFGLMDFSIWDFFDKFWPLILIILGLMIIFSGTRANRMVKEGDGANTERVFGDIHLDKSAVQSGVNRYSSFIGDIHLRISESELGEGEHEIRINTFIGDAKIYLPKDAQFSCKHTAAIGDLKSEGMELVTAGNGKFSTKEFNSASSKLFIRFSAFIGDLKIVAV